MLVMCFVFDSTSRRAHGGWVRYLAWRRAAPVVDVWMSLDTRLLTTCASRTSFHACWSMMPSHAWRPTMRCSTTSSSRHRTSRPTHSIVTRRPFRLQCLDRSVRRKQRCIGMAPALESHSGITARQRRPTAALRRGVKPRQRHSTWWVSRTWGWSPSQV